MQIQDIYKKYRINKGLQEHMVRVAAVAKMIADNATEELDTHNIVTACLVHDLGNIIKAQDMEKHKTLYEPEGVAYWEKVKSEAIERYGTTVSPATEAMVKEIGINAQAYEYFAAIGDEPTERVCESGSLGEQIANYSDMRVLMYGIVSMRERFEDMHVRYAYRGVETINTRERFVEKIETDIFSKSSIQPKDITDESTAEIQRELWSWEIT